MRSWERVENWVRRSGLYLVVGVLLCSIVMWLFRSDPVVSILDVHELDGIVTRGGTMDLMVQARFPAGCAPMVERWLYRVDPEGKDPGDLEWHYLPGAPFSPPITQIGGAMAHRYRLVVPVPPEVEEGKWHYVGMAYDHCGEGGTPPRQTKDFEITVTRAGEANPPSVVLPPGDVTLLPEPK